MAKVELEKPKQQNISCNSWLIVAPIRSLEGLQLHDLRFLSKFWKPIPSWKPSEMQKRCVDIPSFLKVLGDSFRTYNLLWLDWRLLPGSKWQFFSFWKVHSSHFQRWVYNWCFYWAIFAGEKSNCIPSTRRKVMTTDFLSQQDKSSTKNFDDWCGPLMINIDSLTFICEGTTMYFTSYVKELLHNWNLNWDSRRFRIIII